VEIAFVPPPAQTARSTIIETDDGQRDVFLRIEPCRNGPGALALLQVWTSPRGLPFGAVHCYP
jgi:hypothetical protein